MIRSFIAWAAKRSEVSYYVVNKDSQHVFKRFEPFLPDEFTGRKGHKYNTLPWYLPFNLLLHCWRPPIGVSEEMHDHPRWSVTICLKGEIIEQTPWTERLLRPGSVVIRSRKAIHRFIVPEPWRGKVWTLFIVGRRKYQQTWYQIQEFD